MKLLTPFAAMVAAAAAGQVYTSQPEEAYANSAEIYQSALEYQQQGLYSDQSHAYNAGSDQSHAFSGQQGHELAYAGSRPAGEKTARILSQVSESDGHSYQYSYETENGIKAQEAGSVSGHESGTDAHGSYSYTGDDGQVYSVSYTADANGFHAQGSHLPTPPPIPEAIAKSLEQNAKDEAAGVYDDGKYEEPAQHHHQTIQLESGSADHQQLGYQLASQLSGHQLAGHQLLGQQLSGHQLSGQQLSGHQLSGQQLSGHQLSGHQISGQQLSVHQLSGLQLSGQQLSGHQLSGQPLSGHQLSNDHQLTGQQFAGHQVSGQQLSGHQLSGQQQGHQGGQQGAQTYRYETTAFQPEDAFHPGYHMSFEGYKKH